MRFQKSHPDRKEMTHMLTMYKVYAVQAQAHPKYRLRVCIQAEGVQYRLRDAGHVDRVSLSLYFESASACTTHPQPVMHILYMERYCKVLSYEVPTNIFKSPECT